VTTAADRSVRVFESRLPVKVAEHDRFVGEAIQFLDAFQTPPEQATKKTLQRNGVGLTRVDAKIFSRMAEALSAGRPLAPKDLAKCREDRGGVPRLARYWKQLFCLLEQPPSAAGPSPTTQTRRPGGNWGAQGEGGLMTPELLKDADSPIRMQDLPTEAAAGNVLMFPQSGRGRFHL
jgi:hypothetical protein